MRVSHGATPLSPRPSIPPELSFPKRGPHFHLGIDPGALSSLLSSCLFCLRLPPQTEGRRRRTRQIVLVAASLPASTRRAKHAKGFVLDDALRINGRVNGGHQACLSTSANPTRCEAGPGLSTIHSRITILPTSVFFTTLLSLAQTVGCLALAEFSQHTSRRGVESSPLRHLRTNNEQRSRPVATSFGSQSASHVLSRAGISAEYTSLCSVVNTQYAIPRPDAGERDPAVQSSRMGSVTYAWRGEASWLWP